MKRITIQLVLPITIISMFVVTKWWFVLPVDAPDQVMHGFPLIFSSPGFHTSMSLQFFIVEFWIDFAVYFAFWWLVIYEIRRHYFFYMNRLATIGLWLVTGLLLVCFTMIVSISEPHYHFKRPFEIEVLDSGDKFIWEKRVRPNREDYIKKE